MHLVDFGKPVQISGVELKSGELLFGDEHGVIQIPHAIAKQTAELCYNVYKSERPTIVFCQSPEFSIEKLREFYQQRRRSGA